MNAHRIPLLLGLVSLLGAMCLPACGDPDGGAGAEEAQTLRSQDGATSKAEPEPVPEAEPEPAPEAEAPDLTGWTVGTGHRGVHTLAWRPVEGGKIPRNVEFEMDVLILRDEVPQPGLRVAVTGWMPEHEHGFVRSPLVEEVGGGRYRFSGMLLHMRGSWQLRFQVFAGRDTETMTFDLEL